MNTRRSIRLQHYDYAQAGAYFVTICTQNRTCVLASVINEYIQLSPIGKIAAQGWQWLAQQYTHVQQNEWVVMSNHIHGILLLNADENRDKPRKPLGQLIGAFKTVTTKQINLHHPKQNQLFWQRNFHKHIIRNETDLARLRDYIANNPKQWELDALHPDHILRRGGS